MSYFVIVGAVHWV